MTSGAQQVSPFKVDNVLKPKSRRSGERRHEPSVERRRESGERRRESGERRRESGERERLSRRVRSSSFSESESTDLSLNENVPPRNNGFHPSQSHSRRQPKEPDFQEEPDYPQQYPQQNVHLQNQQAILQQQQQQQQQRQQQLQQQQLEHKQFEQMKQHQQLEQLKQQQQMEQQMEQLKQQQLQQQLMEQNLARQNTQPTPPPPPPPPQAPLRAFEETTKGFGTSIYEDQKKKLMKKTDGLGGLGDGTYRSKMMLATSRTALVKSGVLPGLTKHLKKKLGVLLDFAGSDAPSADDVQNLIVSAWVDELLRFLTIKTMSKDIVVPCTMAPSVPVDAAWRALMCMPLAYAQVCKSMGNTEPIDHNPFELEEDNLKRKKELYFKTARLYAANFGLDPPRLYWPDPGAKMRTARAQDRLTSTLPEDDESDSGSVASVRQNSSIYNEFASFFQAGCGIDD